MTGIAARRSFRTATPTYQNGGFTYDKWVESLGLPIHKGYYIPDLRTLELADWEERECKAAFIQLMGQEGVSEARVTEIPPGASLPPFKLSVDEVVYVVEGRGLTTVWADDKGPRSTFEWQKFSMFMIPHDFTHQISNAQGDRPVRLLHYNYLPLAMSVVHDTGLLFNNPYGQPDVLTDDALYSEARQVDSEGNVGGVFWFGNFFPDMRAWDKLVPFWGRGAGGHTVFVGFPGSEMSCHMSVFPQGTYKRAHRHGPGRVIVIPTGEGFSVMWQEGEEKIVIPWHEASMFVPPGRWFHQHFNTGAAPARYLAFHPVRQFSGHAERVEDRERDQIDYTREEPWIRERFEAELGKNGLQTGMPEDAYRVPNYEWTYEETKENRAVGW
jgi:oxalate decarboxylase/phosphoglucose isomerase-like protein (cupin superfamily)